MNRRVVAYFALAFVTMSAISQSSNSQTAQTRCNLTEATAPTVRGLKLGMTAQELLAMFPGITKTKDKDLKAVIEKAKSATGSEAVYLAFDESTDANAQQFAAAGVDSMSAGLYKARVVDFTVQYVGANWTSIDQWIGKLSETFKLPSVQEWTMGPGESPNKVLNCSGILVEAAIQGGSASIRIRSNAHLREIEALMKAADEKNRQAAKP